MFRSRCRSHSPDTGRFNWILGGFAQSDLYWFPPGNFYTGVPHGVLDSTLYGKGPQTSFAVFGQAGYKLLDNLEVQFGARYSYNRSKNDVVWNQYGTPTRVSTSRRLCDAGDRSSPTMRKTATVGGRLVSHAARNSDTGAYRMRSSGSHGWNR